MSPLILEVVKPEHSCIMKAVGVGYVLVCQWQNYSSDSPEGFPLIFYQQ